MSRFPKLRRVVVTAVGILAVLIVSSLDAPDRLRTGLPVREVVIALIVLGAIAYALSQPSGRHRARSTKDVRDAIVGWGIVAAFVAALLCLELPLPYGPGAIAICTVVVGIATAQAHRHADAIRERLFPSIPPTA